MSEYSDWVNLAASTNPNPLDDEPRDFKQKSATNHTITLAWLKSEEGTETGYQLEKEVNGVFTPLAIVAALEFTNSDLEPDTSYNYRIRSIKKQ